MVYKAENVAQNRERRDRSYAVDIDPHEETFLTGEPHPKGFKNYHGDAKNLLDGEHTEKCLVQQVIKGVTPTPFQKVFENLHKNKKLKKFDPLFLQLNKKNLLWVRTAQNPNRSMSW